jgi:hypothetical protein
MVSCQPVITSAHLNRLHHTRVLLLLLLLPAVAKAGYVLPATRGQPALACSGSSYAPAYNRLRSCLPCQSGLQAPPSLRGPQSDKLEVCQVPPGRFWELNVVRECPKGLYRSNWVKTDNRSAIACLSCPAGWTTAATGTQAVGMCNGKQSANSTLGDSVVGNCTCCGFRQLLQPSSWTDGRCIAVAHLAAAAAAASVWPLAGPHQIIC